MGLGVEKYWGYISQEFSGNFSFKLQSKKVINIAINKLSENLREGLSIIITNNQATSGENYSLCAFNFMFGILALSSGIGSFVLICGKKENAEKCLENE